MRKIRIHDPLVGKRGGSQSDTSVSHRKMMKDVYLISIMDVCTMQPVVLTAGIRTMMVSMPHWDAPGAAKDTFDMNPEVYVARLPVPNKMKSSVMVKKIITYESTGPAAKPWYKNFIGIGGKTFDYYRRET